MLELKNVRKSYKTGNFIQNALDGVSVSFRDNEFAAVLGPSGSGKTTMLNIIGGLDRYDSGDLIIDGISTEKYKDRDWDMYRNNRIGFVFQSYNLIPHQTILANVELALTLSGVSKAERHQRAIDALTEVGLEEHKDKKPSQLSGGQMQRVAIARALINNPDILLADEPTGALDTQIGKQVMDLLTKIAKDRLVIMVTHNTELAEQYANRLIHLTDGKITSDSRPFDANEEEVKSVRPSRKTSMSLFTAISLSFSNLITKKGRTFITALASSIGIIGIAAIFALANGINIYIKNVEEETLSIYPLSIQNSSFDITGIMSNFRDNNQKDEEEVPDKVIKERAIVQTIFNNRNSNDLKSLKAYIEEEMTTLNPFVVTVQYNYDITPNIYLADTSESIEKVNPDSAFKAISGASSFGMSFGGSTGGMSVFSQLPSHKGLYEDQYEIVAGHWPESYDEMVLVLGPGGFVSDLALYTMGLKDREELKMVVDSFLNNEEGEVVVNSDNPYYRYEQILGVNFKVVNPAAYYQYDDKYDIWVDKSGEEKYIKNLIEKSQDLKIVGIVKPAADSSIYALTMGINYSPDLVDFLMNEAADFEIVKQQLAQPGINVISGNTFAEEQNQKGSGFDFSKIISIDRNAISKAFTVAPPNLSGITLDVGSVPLPSLDLQAMITAIAGELNVPASDLTAVVRDVLSDFLAMEIGNGVTDPNDMVADLAAYLARADVQAMIMARLSSVVSPSIIQAQITAGLQSYLTSLMQTYMGQMMNLVVNEISDSLQTYFGTMGGQIGKAFSKAIKINMGEEEILELMTAIMNPTASTYERNLNLLGYANKAEPIQISIYPRDFEAKKKILTFLDNYNKDMENSGQDDKVVRYTDIVGTMMSSVTDIVDMVSYALVAFVSIALVVSSIMIGVITYISVLERKKEIGILRAVGASKRDIRRVFNAETMIIGFAGGVLGILLTLIICLIANSIFLNIFDIPELAQLPFNVAIILILVSIFLSFIAGLMPASAASRKDPVEALRAE